MLEEKIGEWEVYEGDLAWTEWDVERMLCGWYYGDWVWDVLPEWEGPDILPITVEEILDKAGFRPHVREDWVVYVNDEEEETIAIRTDLDWKARQMKLYMVRKKQDIGKAVCHSIHGTLADAQKVWRELWVS